MRKRIVKRDSQGSKCPEYQAWSAMRHRCFDPDHKSYKHYGERGITVCEEWLGVSGFHTFLADVGPRPSSDHSIDRIDNDGNYEPGNVRWATKTQQAGNRRRPKPKLGRDQLELDGEVKSIYEWAEEFGWSLKLLLRMLDRYGSLKAALVNYYELHWTPPREMGWAV